MNSDAKLQYKNIILVLNCKSQGVPLSSVHYDTIVVDTFRDIMAAGLFSTGENETT